MPFDTYVARASLLCQARPIQQAFVANVAACLIWLVLLAYVDRSDLGGHAVALLTLVLLVWATISFLSFQSDNALSNTAVTSLGGLVLVSGLAMSLHNSFGVSLPADFVTLGVMIIFAVVMQALMRRQGKARMEAAWGVMQQALCLAPGVALITMLGYLALGFAVVDAVPAGWLTTVVVNPLAAMVVLIHGNPLTAKQ